MTDHSKKIPSSAFSALFCQLIVSEVFEMKWGHFEDVLRRSCVDDQKYY